MESRSFLYALPLIPFAPRALTIFKFGSATYDLLPEAAADRDQHRSFILVLAGFSFTGLLGLAVAPLAVTDTEARARLQHALQIPTYFLLTSFLFYIFALNLQAYKRRWRDDLVSDALIDGAALSLLSSIIVIVWDASGNFAFTVLIGFFAGAIWTTDQVIRFRLTWKIFQAKERKKKRGTTKMSEQEPLDTAGTVDKEEPDEETALEESESEEVHISRYIGDFSRDTGLIRERVYSYDLSALSYITCDTCKQTYIKGDEHECP